MIGGLFDAGHFVAGILSRMDQLIELELKRKRVAILCGLNEKHHQKRDDGRPGIDDELPCVAKAEVRTGDGPDDHDRGCEQKCRRLS